MAGMVENRSHEMSVGMLSFVSSRADAEGYNAGAVLPQGASDVQSIRAAQTADPWAKQTHPSRPARRSARVNTRPADGDSPGLMPAGRFYLGEALESFLGEPKMACLPPLAEHPGFQRCGTAYLRCSPKAEERHRRGVCWGQLATLPHPLHGQPAHPSAQPSVATMVRTIYQQLSPEEVHAQLDRVVEQLRESFPQVAELLANAAPYILAFTVSHWQKLWSNNPQERLNREIRRRRACPRKGTWWAFSSTGSRRGGWWARRWPSSTTNGPKPAAISPSPTPSATMRCSPLICWTQRPDQRQRGRRS